MYGVGKALGQLFEPIAYVAVFLGDLEVGKYFFLLFLVQGVMLIYFDWFDYMRMKHKQH